MRLHGRAGGRDTFRTQSLCEERAPTEYWRLETMVAGESPSHGQIDELTSSRGQDGSYSLLATCRSPSTVGASAIGNQKYSTRAGP